MLLDNSLYTVKHHGSIWGEQVFNTLPILQGFPLTKHVEVSHLSDGI